MSDNSTSGPASQEQQSFEPESSLRRAIADLSAVGGACFSEGRDRAGSILTLVRINLERLQRRLPIGRREWQQIADLGEPLPTDRPIYLAPVDSTARRTV